MAYRIVVYYSPLINANPFTFDMQYPYSLKFSIGAIVVIIVFTMLLLTNVLQANNTLGWGIFALFAIGFVFMLGMLVTKRLIPALKGDIALELDEEGISDYIRDVSISWPDIGQISIKSGRSASTLQIDLKWESDYGTQIAIPLRWVKGKDREIYETALAYFEQFKK